MSNLVDFRFFILQCAKVYGQRIREDKGRKYGTKNRIGKKIKLIVKNAAGVLAIINNITLSSQEQADAIAQVSEGLVQISKVAHNNSAIFEETAATSQELNSQAEMLQQLVAYFKL